MGGTVLDDYLARIGALTVPERDEVRRLCTAIEAGVLAEERIATMPTTRELRRELREVQRQGRIAFDEFVARNLKLVVMIAREMAGRFSSIEDLVQAGNLGLIRAVQGFDWRRGFAFSTYARWWIKKAVQRELALERTIWIPEEPLRRIRGLARIETELTDRLTRFPTDPEIAEHTGMTLAEVADLRAVGTHPASLDVTIDPSSELRLIDVLPDSYDDLADQIHDGDVARALDDALRALAPTAHRVVATRYGLDGATPRTVRRTARELQLTVMDVESIERSALDAIDERVRRRSGGAVPIAH